MIIDPAKIQVLYDQGTDDIAMRCRLSVRFAPVFFRVHFQGSSGSGNNDLTMNKVHRTNSEWDAELYRWPGVGMPGGSKRDINCRWTEEEIAAWMLEPTFEFLFSWDNPDAIDIKWGAELGLYPCQ